MPESKNTIHIKMVCWSWISAEAHSSPVNSVSNPFYGPSNCDQNVYILYLLILLYTRWLLIDVMMVFSTQLNAQILFSHKSQHQSIHMLCNSFLRMTCRHDNWRWYQVQPDFMWEAEETESHNCVFIVPDALYATIIHENWFVSIEWGFIDARFEEISFE